MKLSLFTAVAAASVLVCAPSQAADPFARGMFNQSTMQGWQHATGASAMFYGSVPFQAPNTSNEQPHLGFAMTAPMRVNGAGVLLHTATPRFVDVRFNATDLSGGWTSSLYLGNAKAWTYDPARPQGQQTSNMFESGTSWVVVGLLGAAVIAGTFAITENGF